MIFSITFLTRALLPMERKAHLLPCGRGIQPGKMRYGVPIPIILTISPPFLSLPIVRTALPLTGGAIIMEDPEEWDTGLGITVLPVPTHWLM